MRCLETKGMQRVCVQCSGSRFPSSVPRVSPHDGCPICVCRQGLQREMHSPLVTDTVHARNYVVEVVCDTTSPGCYSYLFLQIPHFTMENAEIIRRSLPRDAWVTSIDLVDTYFHIPIHRGYRKCLRFQTWDTIYQFWALPFGLSPASWVFYQDYDRDQNVGTRDGHQSLSVPGRLAHLFTISRSVPLRHCTSAQSLPHDGPPHSRQEFGTDPKTEIILFL